MPRAEYVQYLRNQGASDDDVKALTEGSFATAAIKAFDAQQAAAQQEIERAKAAAESDKAAYKARADAWYEEVAAPSLTKAQQDAIKANTEAARLRSLVAQSTDEGLKAVAKDMGFNLDGTRTEPAPNPANPANPGFDPTRYFTKDDIVAIAEREGEAIAVAQDIAFEHRQLFPDKPLNFRSLRAEAQAAKKPVEQFWMERYGVSAAREKRDSEAKAAYEAKLREEGRAEVRRQYAEAAANPGLAPGVTSINPTAPRPAAGRDKQPWDVNLEGEKGSGNRVERAAKVWADRQSQPVH